MAPASPSVRQPRIRSGLGPRVLLVLCGAAVGLLLVEGIARVVTDPPRYHLNPILEHDSKLGFRGRPGFERPANPSRGIPALRLNRDGFRGRPVPPAGSVAKGPRIALFGDSFLVGELLEEQELMSSLLEVSLRSQGLDAEVYNLSVVDYGTAQQLLLLREVGPGLVPDAVVLALYAPNDVANNALELALHTRVSAGDRIRPYLVADAGDLKVTWLEPLRSGLRNHLRIFGLLENALGRSSFGTKADTESVPQRLQSGRAPFEEWEIFQRPAAGSTWESAWAGTESLIRAFREESERLGARLLVLVIPQREQVQVSAKIVPNDIAARLWTQQPLDDLLDWNQPEERLTAFLAEEGIDARFLLPLLREAARNGTSVYLGDSHLAAPAHALAADVIARWYGGEAGQIALPSPTEGVPAPLFPASDWPPNVIDFKKRSFEPLLGDGWALWRPGARDEACGWRLFQRGLVVLPRGSGDFRVLGFLPRDLARPVLLEVAVVGMPKRTFRIEEPGRFELRIKRESGEPLVSGDGLAAVFLGGRDAPRGLGPWIQQVGFEAEPP